MAPPEYPCVWGRILNLSQDKGKSRRRQAKLSSARLSFLAARRDFRAASNAQHFMAAGARMPSVSDHVTNRGLPSEKNVSFILADKEQG